MNNRRRQQEEAWGLLGAIGWPPLGLEEVGAVSGELIPGGISYTLYDTFSTDFAAGSVNGTTADTGQARTVTDTNSKLSISGGQLVLAAGATSSDGLWYPTTSRTAGKILLGTITQGVGSFSVEFGWDLNQTASNSFCIRLTLSALGVRDNGTVITVGAALSDSTAYQLAMILRSTGVFYLVKGGVFTNWTLIWVSSVSSASVFPAIVITNGADNWTADNIRVPAGITYIPNPLAYDTFTRADGALGSTETTGPDSQSIGALAWAFTTGIWTISTNKAIATPTVGSDVIVNGAFAADTDWTKGSGWAIGSGTANATASSADLTQTTPPLTVGRWYQIQYTVSNYSAGTIQAVVGGVTTLPTHNANGTYTETMKAGTTAFLMRGAGFTGSIDNVSAKLLTTAELFATVQASVADVIPEEGVTLSGAGGGGLQAGLVLNLDSTSNPQNFILVYLNGNGSLVTEECVAGSYTTKATTSITYSAGAVLRAVRDGTSLRLFYNNGTAGGALTMTANTNTMHGMFSTSPNNSHDAFLIWPRGTSNEFSTLDQY